MIISPWNIPPSRRRSCSNWNKHRRGRRTTRGRRHGFLVNHDDYAILRARDQHRKKSRVAVTDLRDGPRASSRAVPAEFLEELVPPDERDSATASSRLRANGHFGESARRCGSNEFAGRIKSIKMDQHLARERSK